jgi:hypothetical protein
MYGSFESLITEWFLGLSLPASLVISGYILLYLLFEWAYTWKKDERYYIWTAMLTLVLTNLIIPQTATPHHLVFLPIFFQAFHSWGQKWGDNGTIASWFVLLGILIGLWLLLLLTIVGNTEASVMFLPLPNLSLVLLWSLKLPLSRFPPMQQVQNL